MYLGNLTDSPMIVLENSASFKIKILQEKIYSIKLLHTCIYNFNWQKKVKTLIFQCLSGLWKHVMQLRLLTPLLFSSSEPAHQKIASSVIQFEDFSLLSELLHFLSLLSTNCLISSLSLKSALFYILKVKKICFVNY